MNVEKTKTFEFIMKRVLNQDQSPYELLNTRPTLRYCPDAQHLLKNSKYRVIAHSFCVACKPTDLL
jgi:Pyruvate/2-oxoacid:ferredoxin oxidoreductase delta subunit